jgi:Uma2 family endonuclease
VLEPEIELDRKVRQYLQAGAVAVWLIYCETRHVLVYRRLGEIRTYEAGQRFEEPELLPGLAMPVDELFEGVAMRSAVK